MDNKTPTLEKEIIELAVTTQCLVATPFTSVRNIGVAFPPDQQHKWECIKYDTAAQCAWWRIQISSDGFPVSRF